MHQRGAVEQLLRAAGQHQVQRLGRGDEDVGRLAQHRLALALRRVAGADRDLHDRRRSRAAACAGCGRCRTTAPSAARRRRARCAGRRRGGSAASRSIAHRNAASVLPEPVGAEISTCSPEAIAGHAWACAGVGCGECADEPVARSGAEVRSGACMPRLRRIHERDRADRGQLPDRNGAIRRPGWTAGRISLSRSPRRSASASRSDDDHDQAPEARGRPFGAWTSSMIARAEAAKSLAGAVALGQSRAAACRRRDGVGVRSKSECQDRPRGRERRRRWGGPRRLEPRWPPPASTDSSITRVGRPSIRRLGSSIPRKRPGRDPLAIARQPKPHAAELDHVDPARR